MIRGLIFDFDGLILDTETPEYEAWQQVYAAYGQILPLEEWGRCIGSSYDAFNPLAYLQSLVGPLPDPEVLRQKQRSAAQALLQPKPPLPGVHDLLNQALRLGLTLAVASSSSFHWVHDNLQRLGLLSYFQEICTAEQVPDVKPDPALYRLALRRLGLLPGEAIAFEDSPNGIQAARSAGIFCVAVPNQLTARLGAKGDATLPTLQGLSLEKLIARAQEGDGRSPR